MSSMICPNCSTEMETIRDPDFTREVCPQCHGVFLDKNELNAMATGMAGNIEYCSIDEDFHKDKFATRYCPKCAGRVMRKINLLSFSDLIFDFCPQCESFFLDVGEIEMMNAELRSLTPNKSAEEYRGFRDGHLVRIDLVSDVLLVGRVGVYEKPIEVTTIRIIVYLTSPLKTSMRISQERWTTKVAKGLGLFRGQDIHTGDPGFDRHFIVQGKDEYATLSAIKPTFRSALLKFIEAKPAIFDTRGSLEINSSGVVYVEGPYTSNSVKDVVKKSDTLIPRLSWVAGLLEQHNG